MNLPAMGCPDTLYGGGGIMTPCSLAGLHLATETGIQQDLSACHYQPVAECLSPGVLGCIEKMTFSLLVMSSVRAASETCSSESRSPYSEVWRSKARLGDALAPL